MKKYLTSTSTSFLMIHKICFIFRHKLFSWYLIFTLQLDLNRLNRKVTLSSTASMTGALFSKVPKFNPHCHFFLENFSNIFKSAVFQTSLYDFLGLCCLTCIATRAGIYLLKINNGNTRTMCEICSKLTIKITERSLHKK